MSSFSNPRYIQGLKAGADLSAQANLHVAVKLDASGDVVKCGAGEKAIGFLMNLPASGEFAEVASIGGGALGISAGALNEGDELKSDANGHLVAAVATNFVVARAIKAAASGDHFEIMPVQYYLPA